MKVKCSCDDGQLFMKHWCECKKRVLQHRDADDDDDELNTGLLVRSVGWCQGHRFEGFTLGSFCLLSTAIAFSMWSSGRSCDPYCSLLYLISTRMLTPTDSTAKTKHLFNICAHTNTHTIICSSLTRCQWGSVQLQ